MPFSTMYAAATGLGALGTGMATVSNNLANVDTVGYKAQRTNYEDLVYQCYFSSGNHNQVGKGSKVESLQTIFNQGSFKTAEQDTDLAIAGEGFFRIHNTRTGDIMYTRAGVYTIDKNGYLEDPNGNHLTGWKLSEPKPGQPAAQEGAPVDIKLQTPLPPRATNYVTMIGNLNATDGPKYVYPATDAENNAGEGEEGLGYGGAWDARQNPPMAKDNYSYAESSTIYDQAGGAHDINIYYQKNPHMDNVWDYIVTCDPSEDARADSAGAMMKDTGSPMAGLLQKGKLTFDGDGQLKDLEADNLDTASLDTVTAAITSPGGSEPMRGATLGGRYTGDGEREYTLTWGWQDPADPGAAWTAENTGMNPPARGFTWADDQGHTGFTAVDGRYPGPYNFGEGLNVSFDTGDGLGMEFGEPGADAMTVTARPEAASWNVAPSQGGYFAFEPAFASGEGEGAAATAQKITLNMGARKAGGVGDLELDDVTMTQYGSRSNTASTKQDGYPTTALQRVSVTEDGKVVGIYEKGRQEDLYQITLTRFRDTTDLSKKGDNLFMPSRFSDEGFDCTPGQDGAGSVLGNFLEQSTVDTATEIVQMILTQRGFQANCKSITTSDSMLSTAIQTKK